MTTEKFIKRHTLQRRCSPEPIALCVLEFTLIKTFSDSVLAKFGPILNHSSILTHVLTYYKLFKSDQTRTIFNVMLSISDLSFVLCCRNGLWLFTYNNKHACHVTSLIHLFTTPPVSPAQLVLFTHSFIYYYANGSTHKIHIKSQK